MKPLSLMVVANVALLTACTGPACLREQPYQNAEPFPVLKAPPGLNVPPPDPNLSIPEVDDGPVGVREDMPEDLPRQSRLRCLDMPPRLDRPPSQSDSGNG